MPFWHPRRSDDKLTKPIDVDLPLYHDGAGLTWLRKWPVWFQNLILICIDTVRADLFLHPGIHDELSPWLEQAQQYQAAKSSASWTIPAVASTLTGLYPIEHGAGRFSGSTANLDKETPTPLSPKALTLAEALNEAGFVSRAFSAHPWMRSGYGLQQGFQELVANTSKDVLIPKMFAWLDERPAKEPRRFAYLHLMEAHDEHREPIPDIRTKLDAIDAETVSMMTALSNPESCNKPGNKRCFRYEMYIYTLLELRKSVAGILEHLSASGALQDTVVILYSDHGEAFGEHKNEHREMQTDPRGYYGIGHGQYLFSEVMDVPLLAWLPEVQGAEIYDPVSLVDVFPSALHWLDVESTQSRLSGTILPTRLESRHAKPVIFASNISYGPNTIASVRGRYKSMYWPETDQFRIYDLEEDPMERQPLDDDGLLMEFISLTGDYQELEPHYQTQATVPTSQQLKDLQSIGYLQGVGNDDGSEKPGDDQDLPNDKQDQDDENF